jgi:uncharacterized RDD family membrane protein YckC
MPCYVVINATLTIRILYLMSGTDGNSTLPIEPSIAFLHLVAKRASFLSERYLATINKSGVNTNAVELVLDAVTHLVVKGSFLSLNGCNL